MSKQTLNWARGENGFAWWKDNGTYRQEVIGPCLVRQDGEFYIRRRNKNPFGFSHVKEYDWGQFFPPIFTAEGELEFPGQFVKTSTAQVENWNNCWQNPPQPTTPPEQDEVLDPFEGTQTLIDQATAFTSSDNTTRNLTLAAAAIALLTLVIVLNAD